MAGAPAPSREFFIRRDKGGPGVILSQPGGHSVEKCPSLPNIVVWHPRNDDHRRMVCVNAAAHGQGNEIKLIPGQVWMATQHLSVTVLNYNMKI